MATRKFLFITATLIMAGCAATTQSPRPIDQLPMYGGMDRSAIPELHEADQQFIEDVSEAFGSRKQASRKWTDYGIRKFFEGRGHLAMKRCNQAWLLDPRNVEAYRCFGLVMMNRGATDKAIHNLEKARELTPESSAILADLGATYSIHGASPDRTDEERKALYAKSDELHQQAVEIAPNNPHVYEFRALSLRERGKNVAAWDAIRKVLGLGGSVDRLLFTNILKSLEEEGYEIANATYPLQDEDAVNRQDESTDQVSSASSTTTKGSKE
ncbi:hypothetical protein LV476_07270 [Guyparkeria hydrothermalis]|uniref:tetratricopeptide repeat protein n=1 Tax=Guyparkeria hydrothermalis TaxID=923 RepID=UPI0020200F00|nr:hypothetical protein [Guyparkeria hydrothermalis]MCL7744744.1 hypothetical protein [Guyparkeria hydrothermalis]